MICSACSFNKTSLELGQKCEECGAIYPESFYSYLFRVYQGIGHWLDIHRIGPWTEDTFNDLAEVWVSFQNAQTVDDVIAIAAWANHLEHCSGLMAEDYYALARECVQDISDGLASVWSEMEDDASVLLEENWFANTHLYRPIILR